MTSKTTLPPLKTPVPSKAVLLVDDDHDVHVLVRTLFRRMKRPDLTLIIAPDGLAALEHLAVAQNPVALILTDVNMPRLDGHGLIREARAAGYAGPIVLIGAVPVATHAADEWVEKDLLLSRLPALFAHYVG